MRVTTSRSTADWAVRRPHSTVVEQSHAAAPRGRTLDATTYGVDVAWSAGSLQLGDDPHAGDGANRAGRVRRRRRLSRPGVGGDGPRSTRSPTCSPRRRRGGSRSGCRGRRSTSAAAPIHGQRARTPRRAVAVPHGGELFGADAATGDRAHGQLVAGQVPPGDALVARRTLRSVGPTRAADPQPRLVPVDPAQAR